MQQDCSQLRMTAARMGGSVSQHLTFVRVEAMSNASSSYVALIDNVEHIPLAARESPTLSPDERAVLIARVLDFVRDGVVPQAEREDAGIEEHLHLLGRLHGRRRSLRRTRGARGRAPPLRRNYYDT